jgi:hypothetical protein
MLKVLRHGNVIEVQNPVDQTTTRMVNVVFTEEGRSGADKQMSETSAFLSQITGQDVGLSNQRIHTHPVREEFIGEFPVGKEIVGHINRGMYSTPQLVQQQDRAARMIDGRPTYFKTWISQTPEEDQDFRISQDVYAQVNPSGLFGAQIGAASVKTLKVQNANIPTGPQRTFANSEDNGGNQKAVTA